jgi:hypothetical protein
MPDGGPHNFQGQFAIPVWVTGVPGGALKPIANSTQRISVDTVQTLTVPSGAMQALIIIEGAQTVRYTDDGSTPVAGSHGMPLLPTQSQAFSTATELAALQFLGDNTGSFINVSYYK